MGTGTVEWFSDMQYGIITRDDCGSEILVRCSTRVVREGVMLGGKGTEDRVRR